MRLSIIIPFFNVEEYIAECLDSVFKQDLPENEFEVICVNDCSPDNSKAVVLEYKKKYSNLILVEHDINKMLGEARNTGLRIAKGDYVWFIDSDDYIQPNVFAKLLNIAESNDLDILHFNTQRITNEGVTSEYQFFPQNTSVTTGIDYLKNEQLPYWKKAVTAWSKISKRNFLIKNNLFFPEIYFWEDNIQTLRSLLACNRFQYITDKLHFYRDNPTSDMNTNYLGGIKLADKVRFEVECVAILEAWRDKDSSIPDLLIPIYTYNLKNKKKAILYFSATELQKFYRRIRNIEKSKFKNHLRFKDYFIYLYPFPIKVFNLIFMQPLRLIRNYKRMIMK